MSFFSFFKTMNWLQTVWSRQTKCATRQWVRMSWFSTMNYTTHCICDLYSYYFLNPNELCVLFLVFGNEIFYHINLFVFVKKLKCITLRTKIISQQDAFDFYVLWHFMLTNYCAFVLKVLIENFRRRKYCIRASIKNQNPKAIQKNEKK